MDASRASVGYIRCYKVYYMLHPRLVLSKYAIPSITDIDFHRRTPLYIGIRTCRFFIYFLMECDSVEAQHDIVMQAGYTNGTPERTRHGTIPWTQQDI